MPHSGRCSFMKLQFTKNYIQSLEMNKEHPPLYSGKYIPTLNNRIAHSIQFHWNNSYQY